jgi:hypothetical protein
MREEHAGKSPEAPAGRGTGKGMGDKDLAANCLTYMGVAIDMTQIIQFAIQEASDH